MMNTDEFKEFMERADAAENWSDIEPEEWEDACECAGIDYHDYDDPDKLWCDLTKFLEEVE